MAKTATNTLICPDCGGIVGDSSNTACACGWYPKVGDPEGGTIFELKCSNCGDRAGLFVNGLCPGCQCCLKDSFTSRLQALREVKEMMKEHRFKHARPLAVQEYYETLQAKLDEMIQEVK